MTAQLTDKSILLIISGGIAAYKSLELIRLLKKQGAQVRCILTKGGSQFITPLSVSSISENEAYTDLWSLKDETEMGHIRLSREADLIIIAPASANMIAKMTHGMADDLASTTLLASHTPCLIAPAMNVQMWNNAATQSNIKTLKNRGMHFIGPEEGDMACGEYGYGRMSEPQAILEATETLFVQNINNDKKPLSGKKAIVTAGPTYEAIDPVRFIGNRSSGKQGYAIAEALADAGAEVTLVSGPTALTKPKSLNFKQIETAEEMLQACLEALPCDIAVCAAAVSDWKSENKNPKKLKKIKGEDTLCINFKQNPDILKTLSKHDQRPALVIGFAAETENLVENAKSKLNDKHCDWVLANQVGTEKVFGKDENHVHCLNTKNMEDWGNLRKKDVADKLIQKIKKHLQDIDKIELKDAAE